MNEAASPHKKPYWMRKKIKLSALSEMKTALRKRGLNTVCESARCPNIGDCFGRKTVSFLILGNICKRSCWFCDVDSGQPPSPDPGEPENISRMVADIGLKYVVVTSVSRDDLPDGGAAHFAETLRAIRRSNPGVAVELLIPDFGGNAESLETVLKEKPDVLSHNIETVESLYPKMRPQADFDRSLSILRRSSECNVTTKSGIIVGLGENENDILITIKKLKDNGVTLLTVGQYLPPSRKHAPVVKYYIEKWFERIAIMARDIGIPNVFAAPYVRSSYLADRMLSR